MNAIAPSSAPATGPKLDNRRVLAGLIDLVVVVVGTVLLGMVVGILTGGNAIWGPQMGAIAVAWALYYYFALESGAGQTLGKKVMKLRVVRADGGSTGMQEIAVRTLLRVVDGMLMYLVGLVVMLATGERRQRLGDIVAGTIVVDASAAPARVEMAAPAAMAPPPVVAPLQDAPPPPPADAGERASDAPPAGEPSFPVTPAPADVDTPIPGMTAPEHPAAPPAVQSVNPFADPATEPPAPEEPGVEEPAVEEPAVEEPSVEEPAVEEPAVEEPSVEEPTPLGHGAEEAPDEPAVEPAEEPSMEPSVEPPVEPASSYPSVEPADVPSVEPAPERPAFGHAPAPDADEPRVEIVSSSDEDRDEDDADDEPSVNVKSVETVSAMDLIMGDDEDDDSSESGQDDGRASA